jgi:hypothetical protein
MKTICIARIAAILGSASFCLQACGTVLESTPTTTLVLTATTTKEETSTLTATYTASLSSTFSPTLEQSPKSSNEISPTNRPCEIPNGSWKSDEIATVSPMIYPMPIVYIKIQFCMIREVDVYVHPQKDMDFIYTDLEVNTNLEFESDKKPFFSLSFENPDGGGSFSVYGKFTLPDECSGFIMFSKGFSLGSEVLTEQVTITYHAKPIK